MAQEQPEHHSAEVLISGYRLVGGLGQGNTSRVYLAEKAADPPGVPAPPVRTGTRVALKVPTAATRADQAAAERFANEVRLTLRFRHPRLVTGLDGTPFGQGAFLAMRHYPLGTLARHLASETLDLPTTLQVLADVACGMAHLHHAGAVHQDVKTQNIYLEQDEQGRLRAALGDFGSTYYEAQGGEVSGSPFYMAPEVYQGEMTGSPSDVYSFGILAYELLSGERPHRGDSYESLMVSHLTHFPPPLSVPGVARPLTRLLDTTLAKRPGDRPNSTLLRRALLHALGEPDESRDEPGGDVPVSAPRSTVGRHGPETSRHGVETSRHGPDTGRAALATAALPGQVAPAGPAQSTAEKRGWNPFRKKK